MLASALICSAPLAVLFGVRQFGTTGPTHDWPAPPASGPEDHLAYDLLKQAVELNAIEIPLRPVVDAEYSHLSPTEIPDWRAAALAIDTAELALKRPGLALPDLYTYESNEDWTLNLNELQEVSHASVLKAWDQHRRGAPPHDWLFSASFGFRMGTRIRASDPDLTEASIGTMMARLSLREMSELMNRTNLSAEDYRTAIAIVEEGRNVEPAMPGAMIRQGKTIEWLFEGYKWSHLEVQERMETDVSIFDAIVWPGYDTEMTMQLNRQHHLFLASALQLPYPTRPWRDDEVPIWIVHDTETLRGKLNWGGQILVSISVPPHYPTSEWEDRLRIESDLAVTGWALEAYFLSEGKYPDLLSTLVPDYLAAVPVDPYSASGDLLQYDGTTVWSVGRDMSPFGGSLEGWPMEYVRRGSALSQ